MILDIPGTNTSAIAKKLTKIREEGGAIALSRVLNLIIIADEAALEEAVAAANEASREHPCRIIVVAPNLQSENSLDAQIRVGGDAGASEVVVLHADPDVFNHADTLIMPLLLPDAPIVAWWTSEVPESPASERLGAMAKVRITDVLTSDKPHQAMESLRKNHQPGDVDLAWTRLTIWRGLIAAAIEVPPIKTITRAIIEGDADRPSLRLLGDWLAMNLHCEVEIIGNHLGKAITRVELVREDGSIVLDRQDGKVTSICQPGHNAQKLAMPIRDLKECLAEELRRLYPDEVYTDVLRYQLTK